MKHGFCVLTCICMLLALTAQANSPVKLGKAVIKAASKSSGSREASALLSQIQKQISAQANPVQKNEGAQTALNNALNRRIQQAQPRSVPQKDGHIFIASADIDPDFRFSGTVFQIAYNGKKEVYGVIATHAITSDPNDPFGLMRRFKATVYLPGDQTPHVLTAEVVASFPVRTLDISLVKFNAEGEKLLTPYRLGHIGKDKVLQSVGYTHWGFSFIPQRRIIKRTPYTIYTSMPLSHTERAGMCGSALLNSKAQLVGIHTGTTETPSITRTKQTVSFAASAAYLKYLVAAYHQGGNMQFPFYVVPHHFITLNINEYPTFFRLLDGNGKVLKGEAVSFHFPHKHFKTLLKQYPQAKFLQLNTQQIHWNETGTALEPADPFQDEYTTYLYDLEHRQVVSTTRNPPVFQDK